MSLPFFFDENINEDSSSVTLDEATSKHVIQVLRMQAGEKIRLTNGRGLLATSAIEEDNRKRCVVKIISAENIPLPARHTCIAVSLLKNASRYEWLLEKATEMGVREIFPLLCKRTEKQHFRTERMQSILISAMLQSQQCWLPKLHEPVKLEALVAGNWNDAQLFIAHCEEGTDKQALHQQINNSQSSHSLILIGPEGDFTPEEILLAKEKGFTPVALGDTRLRTETAAMVAAALLTQL